MKPLTLLRTALYVLTTAIFSHAQADNIADAIKPYPAATFLAPTVNIPSGQYVSLCFHDVRDDVKPAVDADPYAVNTQRLTEFFDWIRAHNWHPISVQQIIDAKNGKASLPDNAVLISFDDGLRSFYTKAFPLLKAYRYPVLLALETGWLTQVNQAQVVQYHGELFNANQTEPVGDQPGTTVIYNDQPLDHTGFVTWDQLQEMRASGLVEFASHSHNLHRGILANPQGNLEPAAITRAYLPTQKRYETDVEFRTRIRDDLRLSSQIIKDKTGYTPRAIVWPYGAVTPEVENLAREAGLTLSFGLGDEHLNQQKPATIGRMLISNNPDAVAIENQVAQAIVPPRQIERAVQIDIDYLYDPTSAEQTNINLGKLLDRIKAMHISTVYLQAFADPDGSGNASELYFPNSVLPMRADLFNRVAWQLSTRAGVRVFAWLPMLAYRLPDPAKQRQLSVKIKDAHGNLVAAQRDYQRLSPFLPESAQIIGDIYADLAKNMSGLDGVLLHDDAYLAEDEDQSTHEINARWPGTNLPAPDLSPRQKTDALIAFGDVLINRMKPYINASNPFSVARNIYARVVLEPAAESRFAQALDPFVAHYDYVALMAMPYLDGTSLPAAQWLSQLADKVKQSPHPDTTKKVVFELQAKNWQSKEWIPATTLKSWMQLLQNQGIPNLAYYPDDYLGNHPAFQPTYEGLSLSAFPHYGEYR